MAAYLIGFSNRNTNDLSWIEKYLETGPKILASYGGEVLAINKPENAERGNNWERATLIKFPSIEAARSFHNDLEYKAAKDLRISNTLGEMYFLNSEKI